MNETFWAEYHRGEWEPETKAVLERFLKPGALFVDIGAWIGPVTLWALDLGATVVAFEPDPVAYEQLCTNTKGRAVCVQAALAPETGTATFAHRHEGEWGDSESRLDPCAPEGITVHTLSPATMLHDLVRTPDLVKLDIEGGELDVLPALLEWRCPILVSWHHPYGVSRKPWFDGYKTEAIRGDGWSGFSELLAVPA